MKNHPDYLQEFENSRKPFPFHIRTSYLTGPVATHRHDYLEFSYIKDGYGTELINGKPYPLQPGTFTFLLPYHYHQIIPSADSPLFVYHTGMEMSLFAGSSATGEGFDELLMAGDEILAPSVIFTGEQKDNVDRIVGELLDEQVAGNLWRYVLMRAKVMELLVLFDRNRRTETGGCQPSCAIAAPKDDIWAVVEYLHAHFRDNLPFSELAQRFHYNESHLSVTFKKYVGENVSDYLQDLRIRHACSLLAASDMKIIDIAEEVGFRSFSTFARTFKHKKGIAPTQYRKMLAPEHN